MADKKSPASGWPLVKGDFHSGDANSPVAVVTMGSHLDEQGICDAGAALCGSCKTENLGLEKVIANIISNPNIRFVLLCGTEVKGHLSGQTLSALHKGGVKEGRVVGAEGAIPFIENLNDAAIKRFQEQVEIVNIMESEDLGAIKAKINELKARDPGAFAADPIVVPRSQGSCRRRRSWRCKCKPPVPRNRKAPRQDREADRVRRCRGCTACWKEDWAGYRYPLRPRCGVNRICDAAVPVPEINGNGVMEV